MSLIVCEYSILCAPKTRLAIKLSCIRSFKSHFSLCEHLMQKVQLRTGHRSYPSSSQSNTSRSRQCSLACAPLQSSKPNIATTTVPPHSSRQVLVPRFRYWLIPSSSQQQDPSVRAEAKVVRTPGGSQLHLELVSQTMAACRLQSKEKVSNKRQPNS